MSDIEWKETTYKHDVYDVLKEGVRAQALDVEGDWHDVTCDKEIYLCWPSGRRVEVIPNRRYRIEVKPPEPEHVDVVPEYDDAEWYGVNGPANVGWLVLSVALNHKDALCYVWEDGLGKEFGDNECVKYRDKDGNLWHKWAPDRTKEICKAVRFIKENS